MNPRDAFGVVDSTIARATHLPVSYLVINDALSTLKAALDELDALQSAAQRDADAADAAHEKGNEL